MKEDVYFYLDLTKDLLKKKEIIKAIKYYIEEKNKVNLKGHYSLLIFQEEGNPIFITDKKDAGIITNSIEENWSSRPRKQSFFENGLFYIFSYIAETVRKKSKFNRIIVITDTPSDLSEDYQEALFNLVSKIKNFPTFIDILRISEGVTRFFSDDVKLNMLASDTKGGIFYINEKKEFNNTIKKLVKTKQFTSTFADQPERIQISKEDYSFYNHLAKPLLKSETPMEKLVCYFCHEELCPVCTNVDDIPLVCEDCNTSFHNCCITNYTINHNIGIPHILRCPNNKCDVLLKIDEDEIIEVSGEVEVETVKEFMAKEVLNQIPKRLEKTKPVLKTVAPPIRREIKKLDTPSLSNHVNAEGETIKKIRIGGFFGKVYTVKKVNDKIVYERISTKASFKSNTANSSKLGEKLLSLNSSDNKSSSRTGSQSTFLICQQCGTQINANQESKCPNCGFRIK